MRVALALDIGGTKIAGAAVRDDGSPLTGVEVPLRGDPTGALLEVVAKIAARAPEIAGVGIGSAGPVDPRAGTVSPVNIPQWRGFPLVETVRTAVPGVPVRLAGDAQCMALGEWWRGPYGPAGAMLGMVVSTGIGGGLVIDGEPYLGPTGNAGHIGHIAVEPGGEPCPCGGAGCVEMIASGPSMVRWALANGWRSRSCTARGMRAGSTWQAPGADALAADARAGVPVPVAAFRRAAVALATAVLTAAALFDLDNVVIGGGVAAAGPTLLSPLREEIAARAGLPFLRRLRVEATSLGRDAGLYGAAALVLRGTP
ncbi:ROK family protein [Sphaerisporangium flaviroseum]|uniref:ROK family protein n=1 Tax=Sphaerisporangium flaviroseum TaxID=509199 RepID=A0ABP7IR02_9ACTN